VSVTAPKTSALSSPRRGTDGAGDFLEQSERELGAWLDAFGHPVRSAIVEALRERSPMRRGELAEVIDTSGSTLDRSLRRLLANEVVHKGSDGQGYELQPSR
jgi:DNA-binding transcriptional ArsR family regulator